MFCDIPCLHDGASSCARFMSVKFMSGHFNGASFSDPSFSAPSSNLLRECVPYHGTVLRDLVV